MSKRDGWIKQSSGWEWCKTGNGYSAEIVKLVGNGPHPYMSEVYRTPREANLDSKGRYKAVRRACVAKLADAKRVADEAISQIEATP